MRRPYSEPPGTPFGPALAPLLPTPIPPLTVGIGDPNDRPTVTVVFGERPVSGSFVCNFSSCLAVGRSVVTGFSAAFGLSGCLLFRGRTSASRGGSGRRVTTSLLFA